MNLVKKIYQNLCNNGNNGQLKESTEKTRQKIMAINRPSDKKSILITFYGQKKVTFRNGSMCERIRLGKAWSRSLRIGLGKVKFMTCQFDI